LFLLGEVRDGLTTIQRAVANLASVDGQPAGTLKVSMGASFGREYMVPLLGEFLGRYPMIVPDWHFDNRQVDLIAEGFDAAIGGGIELPPRRDCTPVGTGHGRIGGLTRLPFRGASIVACKNTSLCGFRCRTVSHAEAAAKICALGVW
jgi:DNA-binding transcriptional LysR family regulator